MFAVLARAVTRLVEKFGGQVLLELPDDLAPEFLREIASTANQEVRADPAFAWLLVDGRKDLLPFESACGLRELASLRERQRLVLCYASDNRGMSTYTTVFAPLFGPEFPTTSSADGGQRTAGIAGLRELARSLGECLKEECRSQILLDEIAAATESILSLLADSYRREGNTASSWVSQWWVHVGLWASEVATSTGESRDDGEELELLKRIFGVAGLPTPDSGPTYGDKMRRDYAKVIDERWSSAPAIRDELARLARRPSAADGARLLLEVPWEAALAHSVDGDTSRIRLVTSAGRPDDLSLRYRGWAGISESEFLSNRVTSQKLTILHANKALHSVWPNADIFRVFAEEVISEEPATVQCDNLIFQIALLDESVNVRKALESANAQAFVALDVSPGSVKRFEIASISIHDNVLEIKAAVSLSIPSWSGRTVRFQLSFRDVLAQVVGEEVSARFYLLGPHSAFVFYRKSGPLGRPGRVRADHAVPNSGADDPEVVEIDENGLYEIAVALGTGLEEDTDQWEVIPQRNGSALAANAVTPWLLRCDSRPLEDGDAIRSSGAEVFCFQTKSVGERPLSPLLAACVGVRPSVDSRTDLRERCLGRLEENIVDALRELETGVCDGHLGQILLTTSDVRHEIDWCEDGYYISRGLRSAIRHKVPPPPSAALRALPQYRNLVEAYKSLGLAAWIARAEQEEDTQGLLLSRVSIREISSNDIEKLLNCFLELTSAADALAGTTDGFWARFPMSVFAFSDSPARPACEAVLLSPAHPVRLAWLWKLETAFSVVREETGQPPAYAHLSESWTYPWISAWRQSFGQPAALISVPCDTGPDQVFVGWSALVRLANADGQELRAPPIVNGLRFPAGASSGLTEGAVEGAMRAFVRVFPHVRSLKVELPAFEETQRSSGVDAALGAAFARLTAGDESQWCLPGGMRVRDSMYRLGPIPSRDEFLTRNVRAIDGRKVEWERFDPVAAKLNEPQRVHIRLVESQTSHLNAASVGIQRAAFPSVPLRRFPRRIRQDGGIVIDPSFEIPSPENIFAKAVWACETTSGLQSFAMHVRPGGSLVDLETADWTVTGDAGLDPAVLQRIAIENSARHMLWEWRPAVAIAGSLRLEQRPFVTISRVPEAFSASLREKIQLLLPPSEHSTIVSRVDAAIQVLAQRGIGLNSLFAMGHHHATGAIGFYFALRLLERWAHGHAIGETRLIVPVDAIDAFLRSIGHKKTASLHSTRRADLLVMSCLQEGRTKTIRLLPIEIKHYGLTDGEEAALFPVSSEARLASHVDQLTEYTNVLLALQALRDESSEVHARLVDIAIASVIDAATLLDPEIQGGDDPEAQRGLADGSAKIQVCSGALFWFQKGGAGENGVGAIWNAAEDDALSHAKVFVDPAACWEEMWSLREGAASDAVKAALDWCMQQSFQGSGVPTSREANSDAAVVGTGEAGSRSSALASRTPNATHEEHSTDEVASKAILQSSSRVPAVDNGSSHDRTIVQLESRPGARGNQERDTVDRVHSQPHPTSSIELLGVADRENRGLGEVELERRYRRLLKTFEEFKVQVHPPEAISERFTEGPASIVFNVRPGFGVAVGKIEAQLENLKLRLQLDASARIDCKIHRGLVQLDVPKADSERYYVDAESVWRRWRRPEGGFAVPVGEDRYGAIVSIDWADSNSPHLLLGGQTGSGKSVALMSLLMGATKFYSPLELRLILVDPKRVELSSFNGSEYLQDGKLLSEPEDAAKALEEAVIEMEARYAAFASLGSGITKIDTFNRRVDSLRRLPRWLIVLDEYADLTHDQKIKSVIESSLTRLAQKARAAGIHVLVSTQKPIVDVISTVVRGNLPAQLALRVRSAAESSVIIGESGAEKLTGKGDALLKIGGVVTRLQCASIDVG